MEILFINHHHLDSNSGIHIFNLANQLTLLGVNCTVCVPEQKNAVEALGVPLFKVADFDDLRKAKERPKVDLIHAWTPREQVRLITKELVQIYQCPYIVHLEDNEETLLSAATGLSSQVFDRMSMAQLDRMIPPHMSHPKRYKQYLAGAIGFTVLINKLADFCTTDLPVTVFWPGYDDNVEWAVSPDADFRRGLGIQQDEYVVVYTGNVHPANRNEVFSLYLAVGLLNRKGIRTRIVRTGQDFVQLVEEPFSALNQHVIHLGYVERSELPKILSISDVLVQPGKIDQFNKYRFPSKLPEYLATGKPVLLPATNIGNYLQDGEECILLHEGHALEIAKKLEMLFRAPEIREKIGQGGKKFAENNLRWVNSAKRLLYFYQRLMGVDPSQELIHVQTKSDVVPVNQEFISIPAAQLSEPIEFTRIELPFLGYATVKDYCDSADKYAEIMRFDGDLKDVQRPWMVKSIRAILPEGAKVLEIGGGEPLVANALYEYGYEVTIIDPYDGAGNGPQAYQNYVEENPHLEIIRAYFDGNTPNLDPKSFDCIFSISVLEHVPHLHLSGLFNGISKFLKPGGCSIHCTDLVLEGEMADWHREGVYQILFLQTKLQHPYWSDHQMHEYLGNLTNEFYHQVSIDIETYYLSAQGHNLWRGGHPYNEHPFRKIISMQTCAWWNPLGGSGSKDHNNMNIKIHK